MSVHKRTWKNSDDSPGEAWIVAYRDRSGTLRFSPSPIIASRSASRLFVIRSNTVVS
jgi:hypothetical protein